MLSSKELSIFAIKGSDKVKNIDSKIQELYQFLDQYKGENKEFFELTTSILQCLKDEVTEMKENMSNVNKNISYLNADISELQDQLFEEVSVEDLEDIEDSYDELECKNCGKKLYVEVEAIKNNKVLLCPNCNQNLL